jgi:hypothetical protein
MGTRSLYVWVAAAGALSVTLATALATHSVLEAAQSVSLLGGDYGSHAHGALVPVGLTSVTVAVLAILLYVVHLSGLDSHSLPLLARALRARIGWRTVALCAVCACLVLVGMETAEQFAAGRFDGFSSAFGGVPAIGLGLIVLFSTAGNALLSALCDWLAGAHNRIVVALAFLLRLRDTAAPPTSGRSKRAKLTSFRYACDVSQVHGKRGPPSFAS